MSDPKVPQYLDVIANAFKTTQAWRSAAFVLGAIAVALAFALISATRNTPVVLVPYSLASNTGKMTVTTSGGLRGTSVDYVANVALGDLSLILDFTPDNVQEQYERFLNRVTESLYGSQKDALMAQATDNKGKGITQAFYPSSVRVTPDGTKAYVAGVQIRWVAGREIQRVKLTYVITYQSYKGYLHVADLRQES